MRRTLTITAIVVALLVAGVLVAVFTRPRPKLTVKTLGVVNRNATTYVRLAITNASAGFVKAMPGYEAITDTSTNRFLCPLPAMVNPMPPGDGQLLQMNLLDTPPLWRPLVAVTGPVNKAGKIIAALRDRFAPRMKIAAIDEPLTFTGPWRHGTNAEPGDIVWERDDLFVKKQGRLRRP